MVKRANVGDHVHPVAARWSETAVWLRPGYGLAGQFLHHGPLADQRCRARTCAVVARIWMTTSRVAQDRLATQIDSGTKLSAV